MNRKLSSVAIPVALLLILGAAAGVMAALSALPRASERQGAFGQSAVSLPDVTLTDHHARSGALLSELVGDDLLVVTFNYTTCQSICGVGNAVMQELDRTVAARLKRPVRLLSITINPTVDTPDTLAKAAVEYGPSERWLWTTGDPVDIATILVRAEAKVADIELHDLVFIVGDGRRKQFHRLSSLAPTAAEIVAALGDYDS